MRKFIYMSMLMALVLIPFFGSRDPDPARGLRRTLVTVLLFVAAYVVAIVYVVPRLP